MLLTGCHDRGREHHREGADPSRVEEHVKKGVDRLLKKVDATDEQRQKVYALRDRIMPDIVGLAKDREATMKEIQELWKQPTLDAAKLNALVDQRADQLKTLAHKLADVAKEFHDILTPEQREKLGRMGERSCE
ncbi:MAG: Spy/CpxP family protein refolding chaperone [Deltaproteobacteria bacterium]|nr:Spy/CpxP family protein refolding chaperone [Deltaproteobacteria bacterium]